MSDQEPTDRATARADAKAAKARSKAMRPWYKKKRFVLPLALLAVIVAVSLTAPGAEEEPGVVAGDPDAPTTEPAADAPPTTAPEESDGPRTVSGNTENPPEADVAITECTTDELGYMQALGTVTNNSSKASNYSVEIAFETPDGSTQLASTATFVSGLEPGQNAPLEAFSFEEAPADGQFACRITGVTRFADAGA